MSLRDLELVKKEINELKAEQLEVNIKKRNIEGQLSKFDRRLATEQAKVRAKNLPWNESMTLWVKTKEQIFQEREKLIEEKYQLEDRSMRLKLHLQELHDEEYFLKMNLDSVLPEDVLLCPHCLKNGEKAICKQSQSTVTCPKGHSFTLVENID